MGDGIAVVMESACRSNFHIDVYILVTLVIIYAQRYLLRIDHQLTRASSEKETLRGARLLNDGEAFPSFQYYLLYY